MKGGYRYFTITCTTGILGSNVDDKKLIREREVNLSHISLKSFRLSKNIACHNY